MKSEIKMADKRKNKLPKLMIHENGDLVVLKTEEKGVRFSGTIIWIKDGEIPNIGRLGDYCESWNTDMFQDFHGEITLIN